MAKFELKIQGNNLEATISMSGIIDEDVDFSTYNISMFQKIVLDLSSVKSINSCGIREWIKWITSTQASVIEYINCPKVIVDQINMVQGFLPAQGVVKSFFVPYFCDDSGEEKNVLYRYGQEYDSAGIKTEIEVKDSAGNLMEMDVVEAKYFKFLAR